MEHDPIQTRLSSPPAALCSWNPLAWLTVFGPGAIMASLTIGTGELIFSSRGGAIFGYRVLFLFLLISLLKWTLVFSAARHMVLTGVHPLSRWMDLPFGPRGWFPSVLFAFAAICIPIWVSFHATVLGNLLASITGTRDVLSGTADTVWGLAILCVVVVLAVTGGYRALERVQLVVVVMMLVAVTLALVIFRPDWGSLLAGLLLPQSLEFPQWLLQDPRPAYRAIAEQPVWVEATLYVGVIGGSSYDYLAYVSFLRDKNWGLAGSSDRPASLAEGATDRGSCPRTWIRAPLIDCTLSFLVVLVFSAVFVASGARVLGPLHQIPADDNFLQHQAQFVTRLHPWLYPLYSVGALLTMLGTLYGTLEVGPTVLREMHRAWAGSPLQKRPGRMRMIALAWCAGGALGVLGINLLWPRLPTTVRLPQPTQLLIPANLFTGILSCGLICLLNPWMDRRFLRPSLRMPAMLLLLNLFAGVVFVALGLKGYLDHGGWPMLGLLGYRPVWLGVGLVSSRQIRVVVRCLCDSAVKAES